MKNRIDLPDHIHRRGTSRRRFLSLVAFFVLFCALFSSATAQHWVRPQSILAIDPAKWLIADAGTGELSILDTANHVQKLSYPGQLKEPIALARDGVSYFCYDRTLNQIVRINRRFEFVGIIPLPDELKNRLGNFLAITPFGELIFVDTDRNDLIAVDAFGRTAWSITLPLTDRVKSLAAIHDTVFVLFDTPNPGKRILSLSRYGAKQHWLVLSDSVQYSSLAVFADDSLFAFSDSSFCRVVPAGTQVKLVHPFPSISYVAMTGDYYAAIVSNGIQITRWR